MLAVLLALAACEMSGTQRPSEPLRVLFIGNSLTASNGLPAMVQGVADASGTRIVTTSVAFPSVSLEDHWARGDAVRAIDRGGWSFVVLQQGPSARPDSRVLLREYVRRFDERVRRAGARTAVFMVWPASTRAADWDAVHDSYALAAQDIDGVLLAAGDLWRAAWRRDASLALYGADGFHPSPLGTYVAALAISRGLTGRPVRVTSIRSSSGAFPAIELQPSLATLLETLLN